MAIAKPPGKTLGLILLLTNMQYCLAAEPIGLPPPDEPLALLFYKMEVLNYCGLITDDVKQGFDLKRKATITSQSLSPEDELNARTTGWQFGLAEWQNRGLGGFKNWCATEGKKQLSYFRDNAPLP